MTDYTISDVEERTGVPEGTLRAWERRHGFPTPERLPSGHRRYSERDIELVRRVAAERTAGVPLGLAIARAGRDLEPSVSSLHATLRRRRPDLQPQTLPKPLILALSHAIEEESLARAEQPLLFASFQRERFYRQEEARWQELARNAELTIVFADFTETRSPPGGPVEIPVNPDSPLAREWAIVCDAPDHAVCLTAWEPTQSSTGPTPERYFESIWTVEPQVVRDAAAICATIAAAHQPQLREHARGRLELPPTQPTHHQLNLATAITNRTLANLAH